MHKIPLNSNYFHFYYNTFFYSNSNCELDSYEQTLPSFNKFQLDCDQVEENNMALKDSLQDSSPNCYFLSG